MFTFASSPGAGRERVSRTRSPAGVSTVLRRPLERLGRMVLAVRRMCIMHAANRAHRETHVCHRKRRHVGRELTLEDVGKRGRLRETCTGIDTYRDIRDAGGARASEP
jgi:hypothetical protein